MKEYTNSQITLLIDEHIHSQRDRKILKRRLVDGLTFDELSNEFYLTPKQIRNIVCKAECELSKHLH